MPDSESTQDRHSMDTCVCIATCTLAVHDLVQVTFGSCRVHHALHLHSVLMVLIDQQYIWQLPT